MIQEQSYKSFTDSLHKKIKGLYPVSAQIELTYRCNLNCIHCYCKPCEKEKELSLPAWKKILGQLREAGTIWLTITGGEPFLHKGFEEIYKYAKKKGFLVTVFTNGIILNDRMIELFVRLPPYSVEISLVGTTKKIYESITGVKGSFEKVMAGIKKAAKAGLPLVLKSVGLKENKNNIGKIKEFSNRLLGEKKFKFDSFIMPALNGDRAPLEHRLSAAEILAIEENDPDMLKQRSEEFKKHEKPLRDPKYKYHCNAWFNQFYITPSGFLRFCQLTEEHSSDLKKISFEDGFYGKFPAVWEETSKSPSPCVHCELKEFCYHCPARAYLETGDPYSAVPYFCELARMTKSRIEKTKNGVYAGL